MLPKIERKVDNFAKHRSPRQTKDVALQRNFPNTNTTKQMNKRRRKRYSRFFHYPIRQHQPTHGISVYEVHTDMLQL